MWTAENIDIFIKNPNRCIFEITAVINVQLLAAIRSTDRWDSGSDNKAVCVSRIVTVKSCVSERLFKSEVELNMSARSIFFTFRISFCTRWQTGADCCEMESCHKSLWVKSLCKHPHSRIVHLPGRHHEPLFWGIGGGEEQSLLANARLVQQR